MFLVMESMVNTIHLRDGQCCVGGHYIFLLEALV